MGFKKMWKFRGLWTRNDLESYPHREIFETFGGWGLSNGQEKGERQGASPEAPEHEDST
jgi:hypothetical protein